MQKSFTLIELMIVISIVALLGALGLTTYSSTQISARNTKRKADLKAVASALNAYYSIYNKYPSTSGRWDGMCNPNPYGNTSPDRDDPLNPAIKGYIPGLAPEFIPRLPIDPRNNKTNSSSNTAFCQTNANSNCYLYRSVDGSEYKMIAHCTPEGTMLNSDPFFDPVRYNSATGEMWAWQISSSASSQDTY